MSPPSAAPGRTTHPSPDPAPVPLAGRTREELLAFFSEHDAPRWRVDQVLDWVHRKQAADWDEMTNLPRHLKTILSAAFDPSLPSLARLRGSVDTTRKFLWRLRDGAFIESVLIPSNPALYGDRADRHTLCVSTQVGCAYGCRFCASGLDGWKRNLGPDEIVAQWLAVERWCRTNRGAGEEGTAPEVAATGSEPPAKSAGPPASGRLVDNLVIMGMGEPLANYDALMRALRVLNAPWGAGIGARKITVSTSGLAPQIRRLADEPEQFRLALSLHGATDEVRDRIMPVNRKYPLAELVAACGHYLERKGRMITFEYILLEGVNDDPSQARLLAALARRLHAKVNLIPYNTVEGLPWSRPSDDVCQTFAEAVRRTGVATTLRLEKGHDIEAACGQLRLETERQLQSIRPGLAAAR